jgi:hypothetical protein
VGCRGRQHQGRGALPHGTPTDVPKDGGDDLVQRGGGADFQVCAAAQQRLDTLLQQQGPDDVPSSEDPKRWQGSPDSARQAYGDHRFP